MKLTKRGQVSEDLTVKRGRGRGGKSLLFKKDGSCKKKRLVWPIIFGRDVKGGRTFGNKILTGEEWKKRKGESTKRPDGMP